MGDASSTLVVMEDGDMSVFGSNSFGELGLGHTTKVVHPKLQHKDAFGGQDVVMASASPGHSACVTSTGSLWMWGRASSGALGVAAADNEMFPILQLMPTQAFAQAPVLMVACGFQFTVILTLEKQVWSCGLGVDGSLGQNDRESRNSFTQIDHQRFGAGATVTMVAVGHRHSMALTRTTAGDTLWTWGSNTDGQLGHGDGADLLVPVAIPAATFGDVSVVSMDGGSGHTLVVTADGSLWGCGSDAFGQLGLHVDHTDVQGYVIETTMQRVLGAEFADGHGVLMAACGSLHSVVLAKNNTVWVCGFGRGISIISQAQYTRSLTLIDPARFLNKKILTVAAGYCTCGAVAENGDVWLWGDEGVQLCAPDLHARAGRWHTPRPERTLAFMMLYHERLGAEASRFACDLPDCVLENMFDNMQFHPHTDTPYGLRDRMGRRPPRRVTAFDHDAPVLPDDRGEEQ